MKVSLFSSSLPFVLFLALYLTALAIFGVNRPLPWGDEAHFQETIVQFAESLSWETLRTYDEMSTPLPFLLYALWGKVFGLELPALRIFSLLVSAVTLILGYWLYRLLLPAWLPLAALMLLACNPYFAGTSVFVFTDMLAVAFLLSATLALVKDHGPALCFSCAGAMLSRQYLVFFPAAVMLYYAVCAVLSPEKAGFKRLFWPLLAFVPLLGLFLFWGGLSPDCERRINYLALGWGWHPQAFFLYVALFFAFAAPFSIPFLYQKRKKAGLLMVLLPLSLAYWLFPVQASPFTLVETDFVTAGLLHRFLTGLFPGPVHQAFYYLFFLLGLAMLGIFLGRLTAHLKSRTIGLLDFLIMAHVLFLVIMPLSYLWWEKYFLPLLPLSLVMILLPGNPDLEEEGGLSRLPEVRGQKSGEKKGKISCAFLMKFKWLWGREGSRKIWQD